MAGPEEREQAMEVDERVPVDFRVRKAEEGSVLYCSLRGACLVRREVGSMVSLEAEIDRS